MTITFGARIPIRDPYRSIQEGYGYNLPVDKFPLKKGLEDDGYKLLPEKFTASVRLPLFAYDKIAQPSQSMDGIYPAILDILDHGRNNKVVNHPYMVEVSEAGTKFELLTGKDAFIPSSRLKES